MAIAVVHVRQLHLPPGLPAEPIEDERARAEMAARVRTANDAQRAVHRELRRLAAAGWDRVFAEGMAVGWTATDRIALSLEFLGALERIETVLAAPPRSYADRFLRYGASDPYASAADPVWESVRFAPGAELLLALRGEVELLPAEQGLLLWQASRALRDEGVAAAARWSEEREDAILAEVAARGDGPAVVLLGAAHDLTDNVARWNAAHPARRMALVVVSPR